MYTSQNMVHPSHMHKLWAYFLLQFMVAFIWHLMINFFFKGNGALMLRVFPYGAVQFVSYEQFKKVSTNM